MRLACHRTATKPSSGGGLLRAIVRRKRRAICTLASRKCPDAISFDCDCVQVTSQTVQAEMGSFELALADWQFFV
jgi:hypothetical protein